MTTYKIEDCFYHIQNGANIKQGVIDGGYPITRIETIANDRFNRDRMGYAGITDIEKYAQYILEDGDLLMSHINSVQYLGRTVMYNKENNECIIHGMNLLRLKANRKIIHPAYAKYYFYSPVFKEQLSRITKKSVNQASFAVKDLKKIEISCPSISEQINIVGVLNEVNIIIDQRQQELDMLDELVKARFVEMFNCCDLAEQKEDWQPISKIGTIISGSTPKTTIAEYWDGEYRWITPAEIDNEAGYIYDSQRKITLDGAKSCSLTELPIDTVLLTSRAPIGKVALAGNTFFCNQGFKNIVCNNRINPLFLYTLLRLNTDYLNSLGRGATFKEISKKIVENIKIPVPSMDLQNQFSTFVKQIDKSKVAVKKALDEAQLLFDSLMQEYFG